MGYARKSDKKVLLLIVTTITVSLLLFSISGCAPPQSEMGSPLSTNASSENRSIIQLPPPPPILNQKLASDLQKLIVAYQEGSAELIAQKYLIDLIDGNKVEVEIRPVVGQTDIAAKAAATIGTVKSIYKSTNHIYAIVPITGLDALSKEPSIAYIQTPVRSTPSSK